MKGTPQMSSENKRNQTKHRFPNLSVNENMTLQGIFLIASWVHIFNPKPGKMMFEPKILELSNLSTMWAPPVIS